ncbi:heat shock protein HslJ [Deinococcus metalli]|uniref:Heat shock protein HslJ n=1 Tax=Deinococcus metalli TaxID=1141878 RepID=A0A7W8KDF7_9DEIO|nr:META domain-containing protein [Deinococcus metalli]MBB5375915.1 heat shock protein HslJ [Deinococcus metalli]
MNAARGVSFGAATLVLSTGTARLVYSKKETAMDMTTRLHTRWRLVGDVTDPAPTLEFAEDGHVSGDTGCNRLSGRYTVDSPALTFSPLATTRRACISADLQAQETAFLAMLARVRRYAVSGAQLVLTLDDGRTCTFVRSMD